MALYSTNKKSNKKEDEEEEQKGSSSGLLRRTNYNSVNNSVYQNKPKADLYSADPNQDNKISNNGRLLRRTTENKTNGSNITSFTKRNNTGFNNESINNRVAHSKAYSNPYDMAMEKARITASETKARNEKEERDRLYEQAKAEYGSPSWHYAADGNPNAFNTDAILNPTKYQYRDANLTDDAVLTGLNKRIANTKNEELDNLYNEYYDKYLRYDNYNYGAKYDKTGKKQVQQDIADYKHDDTGSVEQTALVQKIKGLENEAQTRQDMSDYFYDRELKDQTSNENYEELSWYSPNNEFQPDAPKMIEQLYHKINNADTPEYDNLAMFTDSKNNYVYQDENGTGVWGEKTYDELSRLNYLYNSGQFEEFLNHYNALGLNQRMTGFQQQGAAEFAEEHPVLGYLTAGSSNLIGGTYGYLRNTVDRIQGDEIDPFSQQNLGSNQGMAMDAQLGQMAEDKFGKVGKYGYAAASSGRDMLMAMGVGGGNTKAIQAIMSTEAANSTLIACKQRGISDEDAYTTSFLAGLIEAATEKYSIEALMTKNPSVIRYIAQNMVAEGSEEMASDLLNEAVDKLINGEKSEFAQNVQAYMDEYKAQHPLATKEEMENYARKKASEDFAVTMLEDGFVGALSGAGMSSVSSTVQVADNYKAGKNFNSIQDYDYRQQYIDQGANSENKTTRDLSRYAQSQLMADQKNANNENVAEKSMVKRATLADKIGEIGRNYKTGEFVNRVESETGIQNKMLSAFEELGEDEETAAVKANAVIKYATNKELTKKEQKIIDNDSNTRKVIDKVENGEFDENYNNTVAINNALEMAKQSKAMQKKYNLPQNVFTETKSNITPLSQLATTSNIEGKADIEKVTFDNGKMNVTLKDGNTKSIDRVNFNNKQDEAGFRFAQNLGNEKDANVYLNNYEAVMKENTNTIEPEMFNKLYNEFYRSGLEQEGNTYDDLIDSYSKSRLNYYIEMPGVRTALQAAYNSGEASGVTKRYSKTVQSAIKMFSEKLGVNVEVTDEKHRNGYYDPNTETVYISKYSDKNMISVLAHEYTHDMEKKYESGVKSKTSEAYKEYRDALISFYKENGKYDDIKKEILASEDENGNKTYSEADIDGEIVANATESFLLDKNVINQICNDNPGFAQKVINFITNMINDLREMFGERTAMTEEAQFLEDNILMLEKAKKLWVKAVKANVQEKGNNTGKGEVKNSVKLNMNSKERYNILKDKNISIVSYSDVNIAKEYKDYNALPEMTDSNAKKSIKNYAKILGIPEKKFSNQYLPFEFYFSNAKIDESANKQMNIKSNNKYQKFSEMLNCIDDVTKNAVLIETHNENSYIKDNPNHKVNSNLKQTYVLISAFKDSDGIIPVKMTVMEYNDGNTSKMHVLMTLDIIDEIEGESSIKPNSPSSSSDYSLAQILSFIKRNSKNDFISKYIPDEFLDNNIKNSYKDSKGRNLSEEQIAYFEKSVVRDKDGNLKVMYHGSPAQFEVFDKKKAKSSGYYGRGFYFSDSSSHAGQYGQNYEVYLNITHPITSLEETHEITKAQLKDFIQELADNEDYGIENYGYGATVDSVLKSVWNNGKSSDFQMLGDLNASCVGDFAGAVQLFNEINGTDYDGITVETETVAFESEQIKDVNNKKPTKDKNIYFSMKRPVEQTKDLIAVHNVNSDNLLQTLELGGFPMPSLAIMKVKDANANSGYGDISVVFGKDTIDPALNSKNKVYSGDAWTPTFPKVDTELNEEAASNVYSKIIDLTKKDGIMMLNSVNLHPDNLANAINRNINGLYGEASLIEQYKDDYGMKQAYLAETDNQVKEMPTTEKSEKMSDEEVELSKMFIDKIPDAVKLVGTTMPRNVINQYGNEINDVRREYFKNKFGFTDEEIDNVFANEKPIDGYKELRKAKQYLEYGDTKTTVEEDRVKAKEIIDSRIDSVEYEKWLKNLFKGLEGNKGIYNGKDYFNPSGSRRSWNALHYEVTLENIVKAMSNDTEKAGGAFGMGNPLAAATYEFNSIDDIKSKSNLLSIEDEEKYNQIRSEYTERFTEISKEAVLPQNSDRFGAIMDAGQILIEDIAKSNTKDDLVKKLKKEASFINYSEKLVDDLWNLVEDIRNMPTGYFEAKPQRAVGFDEVKMVIIPDNASEELKSALDERNIPYETYVEGDETDRLNKLNSHEELKFSMKKKLSRQLDNVLNNTQKQNDYVDFGTTPSILYNEFGFRHYNVLMRPAHAYEMMVSEERAKKDGRYRAKAHYHNLGKVRMQSLLSSIDSAPMFIKSNTDPNNYDLVAVTDIVDRAGDNIMVIFQPNDEGYIDCKPVDTNRMKSAYGKQGIAGYITRAYRDNRILKVKQKNSQQVFNNPRLQLPNIISTANYDNNLTQYFNNIKTFNKNNSPKHSDNKKISRWEKRTRLQLPVGISSSTDNNIISNNNKKVNNSLKRIKNSDKRAQEIDDAWFEMFDGENNEVILDSAKNTASILEEGFTQLFENKKAGKEAMSHAQAVRLAKKYQKKYNSKMGADRMADNIEMVFAYIQEHNTNYDDMLRIMQEVAMPFVQEQAVDTEYRKANKHFIDTVKNTKIKLNEQQIKEIEYEYGSLSNFKRSTANLFTISDSGTSLDTLWNDFVIASGYMLNEDTNSNNQITELADLINGMKNATSDDTNMSQSEKAYNLALDICTDYFANVGLKETERKLIEQHKAYENALDARYKEIIRQIKEDAEKKLQRLKDEKVAASTAYTELLNAKTEESALEAEEMRIKYLKLKEKVADQQKIIEAWKEYGKSIKEQLKDKKLRDEAQRRYGRTKRIESKQKTRAKNQIKRIVEDLQRRLTNPTEGHHVPAKLVQATIDVLNSIDLNTNQTNNIAEKLEKLKLQYAEKINGEEFDDGTKNMIEYLENMFAGRTIEKLSKEELDSVLKVMRAIQTQVRNESKFIKSQIAIDNYEATKQIVEDIKATKGINDSFGRTIINDFMNESLNAQRMADKVVGYNEDSYFVKLMDELNEGQHEEMRVLKDTADIFLDVTNGKENQKMRSSFNDSNPKNWVDTGFKDDKGNTIKVPRSMRVSLAMHMMNEDNMKHIIYGGMVVPNAKYYSKGDMGNAYAKGTRIRFMNNMDFKELKEKLSDDKLTVVEREQMMAKYKKEQDQKYKNAVSQLQRFVDGMNEYEKKWLEASKEYFHNYSGNRINETSLELNGYEKATVENYFPIHTDPLFTQSNAIDGLKFDKTIEGMGFLKERVNGSNPLLLEGIDNVVNNQSRMIARYTGLAIPVRNFNKMFNTTLAGHESGVKKALADKYSANTYKYFENVIKDLSGARNGMGSKIFNIFRGNQAKAVLSLNPTVSIKQAASYPVAAYVLGADALLHTLGSKYGANLGASFLVQFRQSKTTKEIIELANQYSPLLWNRNQGNINDEIGEFKNKQTLVDKTPVLKTISKNMMNWITNIDVATVATLWKASEYNISKNMPDIEYGTEEYYQEVAKLFDKAVEATQPNYTVLQRTGFARNPSELLKSVLMFMTQPMQNMGILYEGYNRMAAKKAQYNANQTEENKAKYKLAQGEFVSSVISQILGTIVLAAATLPGLVLMHKNKEYWEDFDLLDYIGKSVASSMAGCVPFMSYVYSYLMNLVDDENVDYGISIASVEMINDVKDSTAKFVKAIKSNNEESIKKYGEKTLFNAMQMAGVPIKNAKKYSKGIMLHIEDAVNGEFGTFEADHDRTAKQNIDRYFEAVEDENYKKADRIEKELKKYNDYEDEDFINAQKAFMKELHTEVSNGNIDADYAEKLLVEHGMEESKAHFKVQEWETGSSSKYVIVIDAILNADGDYTSIKAAVDEMKEYGYENERLKALPTEQIKAQYIELYKTDKTKAANLKAALLTYYQYIGLDRNKKSKTIDGWVK